MKVGIDIIAFAAARKEVVELCLATIDFLSDIKHEGRQ